MPCHFEICQTNFAKSAIANQKNDNAQMKRFNLLMPEMDAAYHYAALKLRMSDSTILVLYTLCSCGGECDICVMVR